MKAGAVSVFVSGSILNVNLLIIFLIINDVFYLGFSCVKSHFVGPGGFLFLLWSWSRDLMV